MITSINYNDLNDTSLQIPQPKELGISLMEHQKTAIFAMRKLEETGKLLAKNITQYGDPMNFNINTVVGILADKMGSGKSLMIISLILAFKTAPERNYFWGGTKYISIETSYNDGLMKDSNINLLIIPHKLFNQWIKFMEYAPTLKIATYSEMKDYEKIKDYDSIKDKNIIIVTCTKVGDFIKKFQNIKWSRIIIDEADSISMSVKYDIKANFIWLVTGTPKSLRYSNKYFLSNIFKGILPWTFEYLLVKNNDEFIEKSIKLQPPKRITIKCLTPKEVTILKSFIPSHVLNMINAGNSDEAIKTLNFNVDTNENILKVITRNLMEAINNKKLELEYEKKKVAHGPKQIKEKEERLKKITQCITRLETRYESIKEKIHTLNDQYCPICMDEFTKPTLVNCCQSIYCFDCITLTATNNDSCPYCKKKLYKEKMHIITDDTDATLKNNKYQEREKLDVLLELLEKTPDGKFMIFANFSKTFDKIELALKEKNITYNILKGSQKVVQDTIDNFKEGNLQVLMLNARFFGAGMNLQMATHIIIYHRFEYDLEEQVIARAQRLGRTEQLNVFYLIHDNETTSFENNNKFEDIDYTEWIENQE
ncbi:DEAD/SNF2-like helicase [Indivirus ILV1]|uniref:DEAD/SNF2-like helicase n=1 Tax=Indivirus ILV1 TaxID=1977633 RepID=A0A1V0SCW1_9VIRU|nr:DEAD/SNF2-like helicase [Indivirus ILV1]